MFSVCLFQISEMSPSQGSASLASDVELQRLRSGSLSSAYQGEYEESDSESEQDCSAIDMSVIKQHHSSIGGAVNIRRGHLARENRLAQSASQRDRPVSNFCIERKQSNVCEKLQFRAQKTQKCNNLKKVQTYLCGQIT